MNSNFDLTGKYPKETYQLLMQYDGADGSKYDGLGKKVSFALSGGMDLSDPWVWGTGSTNISVLNNSFEDVGSNSFNGQGFMTSLGTSIPNWSFSGGGIVNYPSAYSNPNAINGSKALFLQQGCWVDQTINIDLDGYYVIKFWSCQRPTYTINRINITGQVIGIYVDGEFICTIKPTGNDYRLYTSKEVYLESGSHVIRFKGEESDVDDNTCFVDLITIEPSYKWYFNFTDKISSQGKYILSNTSYEFINPYDIKIQSNPTLGNVRPGVEILNEDNKMITYLVNLTFTGRFLDSTPNSPFVVRESYSPAEDPYYFQYGQSISFNIQPTVNGNYSNHIGINTHETANLKIWGLGCTGSNVNPYDQDNTAEYFNRCSGGSLSFIYQTDQTWYLDFLMTMESNHVSSEHPDAWRFESLSWSVISI